MLGNIGDQKTVARKNVTTLVRSVSTSSAVFVIQISELTLEWNLKEIYRQDSLSKYWLRRWTGRLNKSYESATGTGCGTCVTPLDPFSLLSYTVYWRSFPFKSMFLVKIVEARFHSTDWAVKSKISRRKKTLNTEFIGSCFCRSMLDTSRSVKRRAQDVPYKQLRYQLLLSKFTSTFDMKWS